MRSRYEENGNGVNWRMERGETRSECINVSMEALRLNLCLLTFTCLIYSIVDVVNHTLLPGSLVTCRLLFVYYLPILCKDV